MIPVSEAWNEDAFEIREDCVEALAALGRAGGQRAPNFARRDPRQDRIAIGCFEIVGNPVRETMRLPAKVVRTTDLFAPP